MALHLASGKPRYLTPDPALQLDVATRDGQLALLRDADGELFWAERSAAAP